MYVCMYVCMNFFYKLVYISMCVFIRDPLPLYPPYIHTHAPADKNGLYHYGHRMMKKRIVRLLGKSKIIYKKIKK